jgi:hypothetical protein
MKHIVSVVVVFFVASCATAQPPDYISSGTAFPPVAPPAALTWTVATDDGRSVSMEFKLSGGALVSAGPSVDGPWPPFGINGINEANAPAFKVDFAAWSAALADPAYHRSIYQLGDQIKESAVVRSSSALFELHHFLFTPGVLYQWPPISPFPGQQFNFSVQAWEERIVPEPSTSIFSMIAFSFCCRGLRLRRRCVGKRFKVVLPQGAAIRCEGIIANKISGTVVNACPLLRNNLFQRPILLLKLCQSL